MITFTKSRLPWGWLGNMSPYRVVDPAGILWPTTEHLFQAMRFSDDSIREAIRAERSPMTAKFLSRKHTGSMSVEPQSFQDLANMRACLIRKIHQHRDLYDHLLSSGREEIVEDVTNRQRGSAMFWGAALVDGNWCGENHLGRLWMEVRREIQRERT